MSWPLDSLWGNFEVNVIQRHHPVTLILWASDFNKGALSFRRGGKSRLLIIPSKALPKLFCFLFPSGSNL